MYIIAHIATTKLDGTFPLYKEILKKLRRCLLKPQIYWDVVTC